MPALELDKLTWPQVRSELQAGRTTVVMALGATEQHGHHMALATDALIGDYLAWEIAERLDSFVAPTVRFGCSEHHLDFPGTISLAEETFHAVVADVLRSLSLGGFDRAVLLPTHGGNFAPLGAALERVGQFERLQVLALTDVGALLEIAQLGEREFGVPLADGGLHAGEWETSMLQAIHPDLEHPDQRRPGYIGPPDQAIAGMFSGGVHSLTDTGAIGDPTAASAEHGRRYLERVVEIVMEQIGA